MNKKNREILIKTSLRRFPLNFIKTIICLWCMMRRKEYSFFPYKFEIESSAICNLRCIMCARNSMKRKQGTLKFETFKKVYDELRPPYVNLTGYGEPLLNPDLFRIITYARKKGSLIKIDTNGTLLNQRNIEKILNTGIDFLSISIDSIDKKTYERIRIGAKLEEVIFNLKNLIKRRNEKKSKTEIHVYITLMQDNFYQFSNMIRYLDSLGVDLISGNFIGEETYKNNEKRGIRYCDKRELDKLVIELKKLRGEIKADLEIDEIIEYIETWDKKEIKNWKGVPCFVPWYGPFITWDGFVAPCCYCGIDKGCIFGDIKQRKFKDIWNDKKIKQFRKMVAENRGGLCSSCRADETNIREQFKCLPFINKLVR